MAALPPDLDFAANPAASPARMNQAMANINNRLLVLEAYKPNFDALLVQVAQFGYARVNDVVLPIYNQLLSLAALGAVFQAGSATPVAIGTGPATFVLASTQKDQFAASGYLIAVSAADSRNALSGRYASYDRSSGTLVIDVMIASGSGTPNDWTIMPCVPPFVPASIIDPGSDGSSALAAVPYIPEASIASGGTLDLDAGTA